MEKPQLELIYAIIFLLSLILYLFSIVKYILPGDRDWYSFTLSLIIMFLALWGYLIVKKHLK